ncbi:MAG: hypothetical protein ACRCXC_03020 [Legionella sp.]
MPMIKLLFKMLILTSITITCFAVPPFQILRTCIDGQPFEDMVAITRIDGDGYADKSMDGCEEQHDRSIDGHIYGTLMCHDKFYFIIRDKKIDPEKEVNKSINPEINPGVWFTTRSLWYRIALENKEYLCIRAPLSEQGVGAAHNQYYIIENAFDASLAPKVYFYFLEENIAPITSPHL